MGDHIQHPERGTEAFVCQDQSFIEPGIGSKRLAKTPILDSDTKHTGAEGHPNFP